MLRLYLVHLIQHFSIDQLIYFQIEGFSPKLVLDWLSIVQVRIVLLLVEYREE